MFNAILFLVWFQLIHPARKVRNWQKSIAKGLLEPFSLLFLTLNVGHPGTFYDFVCVMKQLHILFSICRKMHTILGLYHPPGEDGWYVFTVFPVKNDRSIHKWMVCNLRTNLTATRHLFKFAIFKLGIFYYVIIIWVLSEMVKILKIRYRSIGNSNIQHNVTWTYLVLIFHENSALIFNKSKIIAQNFNFKFKTCTVS